jgi:hypothetical protein
MTLEKAMSTNARPKEATFSNYGGVAAAVTAANAGVVSAVATDEDADDGSALDSQASSQ